MQIRVDGTWEDVNVLDARARAALGALCTGVSAGGGWAAVNLVENATGEAQLLAAGILNDIGVLDVGSDKLQIQADDVDTATITVPSAVALAYIVTLDGVPYADGVVMPQDGICTETLATDVTGSYRVSFYKQVGTFASGGVVITAVE